MSDLTSDERGALWRELQQMAASAAPLPAGNPPLTAADVSRVIEMAWEDRTPFEAIAENYDLSESEVIALMRRELQRSSFKLWRKRAAGRSTKHVALRAAGVSRAYCPSQYKRP